MTQPLGTQGTAPFDFAAALDGMLFARKLSLEDSFIAEEEREAELDAAAELKEAA